MSIKVGDLLPEFTAVNDEGKEVFSKDLVGTKSLVLYFYPKDETPGCTAEACSFRDQYKDFEDIGAEVIGVSRDSIASHQKFKAKHRLPFMLLSDNDGKLEKKFGVKRDFLGLIPGRVTYVFNAKGLLIYTFNSQLNATKHVKEALDKLRETNNNEE
jgi:peroxiredoxin Q/BCP